MLLSAFLRVKIYVNMQIKIHILSLGDFFVGLYFIFIFFCCPVFTFGKRSATGFRVVDGSTAAGNSFSE